MLKSIRFPVAIAFIIAGIAILGAFLPYVSCCDEYKLEYFDAHGDEKVYESSDLTFADCRELSLWDYARLYYQAGEEIFKEKPAGIFYAVLFLLPGAIGIFCMFWALCKRATPLILNSIAMGASLWIINWDVVDRGIMPSSDLVWGISHVLYYPCAVVIFVCGIWLFVGKHRIKKQQKRMKNSMVEHEAA